MYVHVENSSKPGNKTFLGYFEVVFVIGLVALMCYLALAFSFYHISHQESESGLPEIFSPPSMSPQNFALMQKYQSCKSAGEVISGSCALQAFDFARAQGRSDFETQYSMDLLNIHDWKRENSR